MFHYLTREFVCNRLRINRRFSYRVFAGCRRIRSDYVLDYLNQIRSGVQEKLICIPSDLRTIDELAADLKESEITVRDLRAWTHRKSNPPPFFHVNKQVKIFRLSAMLDWLDAQSVPRRYLFGTLQYEHKREEGTIIAPLQPVLTWRIPIFKRPKPKSRHAARRPSTSATQPLASDAASSEQSPKPSPDE